MNEIIPLRKHFQGLFKENRSFPFNYCLQKTPCSFNPTATVETKGNSTPILRAYSLMSNENTSPQKLKSHWQ